MMKTSLWRTFMVLILAASGSQATVLRDQLINDVDLAGDVGTDSMMGALLSADQNRLVVSIPGRGDVLVFEYDGVDWNDPDAFHVVDVELATLADQPEISALAIDQNRIAVGVANDSEAGDLTGVVHVFEFDGNQWSLSASVRPEVPELFAEFGGSVDLSGDWLVVSADRSDAVGVNAGLVYVFRLDAGVWTEQQQLTGDDTAAQDRFGSALSLSADQLLVGAPYNNDNAATTGAAYVFDLVGLNFVQSQKLIHNPAAANSEFGSSVDLGNDVLVVGAKAGFNDVFLRTGSASIYVFDGLNWVLEDSIYAGAEGELFGSSVMLHQSQVLATGLSGVFAFEESMGVWSLSQWLSVPIPSMAGNAGQLLLGFPGDDEQYENAGKVSVYEQPSDDWVFNVDLYGRAGHEDARFGQGLALEGDRLAIGVPQDQEQGIRHASVRVMVKNGAQWQAESIIRPADVNPAMSFGADVELNDDWLFARAVEDNAPGAVYVFRNDQGSWFEEQKLIASDGFNGDGFGRTIHSFGEWLFIASEVHPGDSLSRVYVFQNVGGQWGEVQILTSGIVEDGFGVAMTSSDTQLIIHASFSTDPAFEDFYLFEQLLPGQWSPVGNIQPPPDLQMDEYISGQFSLAQNHFLVTSSRIIAGVGGVFGVSIRMHLYLPVDGQWVHEFSGEAISFPAEGGYDFKIATNGQQVMFTILTQDDFYTSRVQSRFYNIKAGGFQSDSVLPERGQFYDQTYPGVTAVMDDQQGLAGFPFSTLNGFNSGSVQVYDLTPPDLIYLSGFD
jgi:hypothetical protein